MSIRDAMVLGLLAAAGLFFLSGTVALLRFPDLHSRLHGLTKADNLGLGLTAAALAVASGSLAVALKLAVVWLLALLASATNAYLIADASRPERIPDAE
jgi:multicomponent Na+:H+ antiporter subunit G